MFDRISFGEIVFDFTFMNILLREKQLYFIHNNKDIVLTFGDAKANYPTNSPDFESIQSSIKVQ